MYKAIAERNLIITDLKELMPQEKSLLFILNSYSNKAGESYPSIETLSDKLNISITTTHRYIRALIDKNYIKVKERKKQNGTQDSNLYILTLPDDNLKSKLLKLETIKKELATDDIDTLPPVTDKLINININKKYNSKSKENRPRIEELKELETLQEENNLLDKAAMQKMKRVFYSLVTSNKTEYLINNKKVSKQTLIDKLRDLSRYDIKALINAITGKKIYYEYSYIINTLFNYKSDNMDLQSIYNNSNYHTKKSLFTNIEQQDYDFEMLERVGGI